MPVAKTGICFFVGLSLITLSAALKINRTKKVQQMLNFISCGGRIRTCDLQVMSLASYQLLHSAMFFLSGCKGTHLF